MTTSLSFAELDTATAPLRPADPLPYPPHSTQKIEKYFYDFWKHLPSSEIALIKRKYLPIFWTNYYLSETEKRPCPRLQQFIETQLPKSDHYFTIVQHADGIAERLPPSSLIFSCGGLGDVPIPLLCAPHPLPSNQERDLLASFVGIIQSPFNDRTGIRTKMRDMLGEEPGIRIIEARNDTTLFRAMMSRSVFALCPRGYGKTSFRLYEAIQMGAIPVYIHDDPWLPYQSELDWNSFSVLCPAKEMPTLAKRLKNFSPEKIERMQMTLREVYEKYFTFEATCNYILRVLKRSAYNDVDP
jgi:hypothetical protein